MCFFKSFKNILLCFVENTLLGDSSHFQKEMPLVFYHHGYNIQSALQEKQRNIAFRIVLPQKQMSFLQMI